MTRQPHIASTTMKYSIRGHGCVQEVDNMHKKIGDAMKVREFYSSFSFLRVLLQADRKNTYTVIQMQESRFKDYKSCSKMLRYDQVPFTKLRQLRFEWGDPNTIKFKLSHADKVLSSVSIGTHARATKTRSRGKQPTVNVLAQGFKRLRKL